VLAPGSRSGFPLPSAAVPDSKASLHVTTSRAEEDFELCNECGGLCCALFLAHDENGAYIGEGWLPEYIALWEERLVASGALRVTAAAYLPGEAGVAPLHDPRVSHLPTPEGEAYRAALPDGVDYRKCVFCDAQTGCRLPRTYRAPICGEYVCELWRKQQ
jgi:hypothetical protein